MRELLRAVFKTGSGSAASLALGMLAMKIIAVVLGPAGVGLFSLLRQTQQTALTVAVLNGQMALVQGTASRGGQARVEYLATVLGILALTGSVVSLGVLAFAPRLANWLIGQTDAATVSTVRWLALSIFLSMVAAYLTSLLNGYRAIGRAALVQTAHFGLMAGLAYPAARLVKVGYLMAFGGLLAASALASLAMGGWFAYRSKWLAFLFDKPQHYFSRASARHFLRLAGTMLITGFVGTAVPLAVRALTTRRFGLHGAGIFDVSWTLSMAYVTLILASFSSYYLPTLSQTHDPQARQVLVYRVLRLSMCLMVPLVVMVITFKALVVKCLYTAAFLPSLKIMRWMLIGDYFKVISWVFAIPMVAYADMRTYLWTEVLWGGLMLGGAAISVLGFHSLEGVGISFIGVYITYLGYTLFYVYRRHHLQLERRTVVQWLIGLAVVVSASAQTWNASQVNWVTAGFWLAVTLLFTGVVLNGDDRRRIRGVIVNRFKAFPGHRRGQ